MSIPNLIRTILDFFYPIFQQYIPKKTYYYAACGGANLVLSWLLFFFFYQIVFQKQVFHFHLLGEYDFAFSAYTLSSVTCFVITFTIGFLLMKYVVFTSSELQGRIQLVRYALSSIISGILGWSLLKIFIELLNIYPSISNILASCVVVTVSYLIQRNYTFK